MCARSACFNSTKENIQFIIIFSGRNIKVVIINVYNWFEDIEEIIWVGCTHDKPTDNGKLQIWMLLNLYVTSDSVLRGHSYLVRSNNETQVNTTPHNKVNASKRIKYEWMPRCCCHSSRSFCLVLSVCFIYVCLKNARLLYQSC